MMMNLPKTRMNRPRVLVEMRRRLLGTTSTNTTSNTGSSSCRLSAAAGRRWNGSNTRHCSTRAVVSKILSSYASLSPSFSSSTSLSLSFRRTLSTYPPHTLYPMPALSPTMDRGSIASWKLNEGDAFIAGDALCTIETDKASIDFEAQDDGVLAKILVPPGLDIAIGTPICVVTEEAADAALFADFAIPVVESAAAVTAVATPPSSAADNTTTTSAVVAGVSSSSQPSLLMPSARHLAESNGKDATILIGSAKGGRVTKSDVQIALQTGSLPNLVRAAVAAPSAAEAAPSPTSPSPLQAVSQQQHHYLTHLEPETISGQSSSFVDVPNTKMRKIIASRLSASKREVPHFYACMDVALDEILALRKQWQQNHSVKVSVNDFVIRSSALALRDVPRVNKGPDSSVSSSIDVSVAVATPTGLITPIVFRTDTLGLSEISRRVADLAARAREGHLQPHEYQGGSFSISNLGMFGVSEFSAVINPPQAAILAVGGGTATLVPGGKNMLWSEADDSNNNSGKAQHPPVIQTIMTARLSADRRVVDEATASLFLQALRHYMQTPELLLL